MREKKEKRHAADDRSTIRRYQTASFNIDDAWWRETVGERDHVQRARDGEVLDVAEGAREGARS